MKQQIVHYRSWQLKPAWTPCGVHKRAHRSGYTWTTDWGVVTCQSCLAWRTREWDYMDRANNRRRYAKTEEKRNADVCTAD